MPELKIPIRSRGAILKILVRDPSSHCIHDVPLTAFVDTGASDTMLDIDVIRALGAAPCHQVGLNILGRADTGYYDTFQIDVALIVPSLAPRWITLTVLGGPCYQTGAAAALGRDFLRHHFLTYDGIAGKATLSW
jgi:hypothetical protein